jgi:FkbM family methyltransferase
LIRSTGRLLGAEVQRFEPATSRIAQMRAMFAEHRVDLVFDVGANVGQFGAELRGDVGYRGQIVSFEPTLAAYGALSRRAAADGRWTVAERAAVGAAPGHIAMNISDNSVSSSALPMLAAHEHSAPTSRYVGSEMVPVLTLDSVAPGYLSRASAGFVKIDTQGYEMQVLQGAANTLAQVVGLQLEVSLIPLYEGQVLMPQLLAYVADLGFELWGMTTAFADRRSGRTLQMDATFFRRG